MKLEKAFQLGVAFCTGYRYQLRASLSLDSHIEKPKFFTNKQNKKVAYDPKTHETSGNGKEIDKATEQQAKKVKKTFPKSGKNLMDDPPSKDVTTYLNEANGNYDKAITSYYEDQLRGGSVKTALEIDGKQENVEVYFDSSAKREFKKFRGNLKEILNVLPYTPEVLNDGEYAGREEDKKNHIKQVAFHYYKKTLNINGVKRTVIVDVGETKSKFMHAYNVNTEGTETFKRKNKWLDNRIKSRKKKAEDFALLPSFTDSALFMRRKQPFSNLSKNLNGNNQRNQYFLVNEIRVIDTTSKDLGSISFKED